MAENIFLELQSTYVYLSRIEKIIADQILQEPQSVINCSMDELAKQLQISQGSINNFSKKFSSGGFSALKLKIASCLSSHDSQPFSVVDHSRSITSAMETKINENLAAFRSTQEVNSEDVLMAAVRRILAANKIEIYGVYRSSIVANDLYYQLIQLGIPATFVSDTLMCSVSATMLDSGGLVIAISSSGRTKEIIDAVDIAKKNQVPVIALTANRFSPLAKRSDVVLLSTPSGISISDRSDEIRLTQLLVIDTLCAYIRSLTDVSGTERYYKLQTILNSHSIED